MDVYLQHPILDATKNGYPNCTPMRANRYASQFVVRNWAFMHQDAPSVTQSGMSGDQPSRAKANTEAADLHKRADVMFKAGYEQAGWALRKRAWRLEGAA